MSDCGLDTYEGLGRLGAFLVTKSLDRNPAAVRQGDLLLWRPHQHCTTEDTGYGRKRAVPTDLSRRLHLLGFQQRMFGRISLAKPPPLI
ncbi:hypothetical protein Y1Q_0023714 [Alligator mississippiensis]|uniref:Uncharacterized protein n=1 Tax=Alligator mississippiensis TaxID=8496 RepID=A0A151MKB3_ALLMI|nr:hypothetical protein Y1Q_0023714 [Alligator mississippiensis]